MSADDEGREPIRSGSPPADVEEALQLAREHAQTAAAELAAALAALLDAGTLATRGALAAETPLGPVQAGLLEIRRRIAPDQVRDGASLLHAVAEALDAEIARWEERSKEDPNGRAVLRAFLGVRELLWELGVRQKQPDEAAPEADASPDESGAGPTVRQNERTATPRVQRISVEG